MGWLHALPTDAEATSQLQSTAEHCRTLQNTADHCRTLQNTAEHCRTLQNTAELHNTAALRRSPPVVAPPAAVRFAVVQAAPVVAPIAHARWARKDRHTAEIPPPAPRASPLRNQPERAPFARVCYSPGGRCHWPVPLVQVFVNGSIYEGGVSELRSARFCLIFKKREIWLIDPEAKPL